jgi:oligopeptide/dipeptide ABC transporter ATP-binding protein
MPQAAPRGARLTVIAGQVPNPDAMPFGCRFHPRCAHAREACETAPVSLMTTGVAAVRCLRHAELELRSAPEVLAAAGDEPVEATSAAGGPPLLAVHGLVKHFLLTRGMLARRSGAVRAVDGVDLEIAPRETLGLVGESGSGKSTIARLVIGLEAPTAGAMMIDGEDVAGRKGAALRAMRGDMQIVFQDPYSSLDPRATIGDSVGEPLEIHEGLHRRARDARVAELLSLVGLGPHVLRRFPHEFSGGQRQRIAVARALALSPRLLVCDEPVSSLDVSTQSQVINLLADLQQQLGIAYLFIAHDLSVVRHISHRIAVMYLGRIVEQGPAGEVAQRPRHPYTEALVSAIPIPDPMIQRSRKRIVLQGDVPSPADPPAGCRFHTRCAYAMDICAVEDPPGLATDAGTTVHCHLHTHGPQLAGLPLSALSAT